MRTTAESAHDSREMREDAVRAAPVDPLRAALDAADAAAAITHRPFPHWPPRALTLEDARAVADGHR